MATGKGTRANFQIYPEQYYSGRNEMLMQRSTAFNGAVRDAMRMQTRQIRGDFEHEAFFKEITNLTTYRNPASTSSATAQRLDMGENVGVKIPRKHGPVIDTADRWRRVLMNGEQEMSFLLGEQAGKSESLDYLNTAILCLRAALTAADTAGGGDVIVYDGTSAAATRIGLNNTRRLFGDAAESLVFGIMHSKVWYDLVGAAITTATSLFEETLRVVDGGNPGTLNIPMLITDSPALITAGTPDTYHSILLTSDAVMIDQSEEDELLFDRIGGNENIEYLYQAEYAFNVKLKGLAYDTTAGANPTDATLADTDNWTQVASSVKSIAGVMMNTQ